MSKSSSKKKHKSPLVDAAAAVVNDVHKKKERNSKAKKNHQSPLLDSAAVNDVDDDNQKKERKKRKRSKEKKFTPEEREELKEKREKLKQISIEDDAEDRRLTSLLFGGGGGDDEKNDVIQNNHQIVVSTKDNDDDDDDIAGDTMFELDTRGEEDASLSNNTQGMEEDSDDDDDDDEVNNRMDDIRGDEEKPAWVDDDDVEVDLMQTTRLKKLRNSREEDVSKLSGSELEQRLRTRFQQTAMTNVRTDWANMKGTRDDDDDVNIDASAASVLATSTQQLPPQILSVLRCPNANKQDYSRKTRLESVHFHPGSDPDTPLLLTAGSDNIVKFYTVGEEESQKIHGIHFPRLPITTARFLGDSGTVAISGKRSFFYLYDAIAGKLDHVPKIMGRKEKTLERFAASPDGTKIAFLGDDGYIIFVDVKSKQWMYTLKINGSVTSVTFSKDSNYIFAGGSDGDVYQYDLRIRRCVERRHTEDGTMLTSLSASSRHLAVGSESGVVNFYSNNGTQDRSLLKSIMNLQTSVDNSLFNHDGQILAFSSQSEKGSLKLLHTRTGTVFSNWPTPNTPLNYALSQDFSPESKFLAMGNDKGQCLLYKLLHYHS